MTDLVTIRKTVKNWFEEEQWAEGRKYPHFRGAHTFEWDMTHGDGLTLDGMKFEFVERVRDFNTGDLPEEQFIFSVENQMYMLSGQSDSWEGGYPEWDFDHIQPVAPVEKTYTAYEVL